jgi:hypothetical protein
MKSNFDTIEKVVIGVWLCCVVAIIAFWATVAYLAIHFLQKIW